MLRKTMIVLAKVAALTGGLTVEAFAHGDAEGMRGPRCGWLRVKLVAPTSQAATLFYGRLFEIAPAVKPTRRYDGARLQADGDAGRCGQQSGQSRNRFGAWALAKRHVDYGVKAADYTPVGAALLWTLEQGLGLR
jgi:hypothetical protein